MTDGWKENQLKYLLHNSILNRWRKDIKIEYQFKWIYKCISSCQIAL